MTRHPIGWRGRAQHWFIKTRPSHAKHNQSSMPGPFIQTVCYFVFSLASLFTYLCSHLLRRIVFELPRRWEENKISGWKSCSLCAGLNWTNCGHCKHKPDVQIGSTRSKWFVGGFILQIILSSSEMNFHCVFPRQPTIADILNLGWWATAAAWWVLCFFLTFSNMVAISVIPFFFSSSKWLITKWHSIKVVMESREGFLPLKWMYSICLIAETFPRQSTFHKIFSWFMPCLSVLMSLTACFTKCPIKMDFGQCQILQ